MSKFTILLCLAVALPTAALGAPSNSISKTELPSVRYAFSEVYDKVAPSVVVLEVTTSIPGTQAANSVFGFFLGPRDQRRESLHAEESEGSGFIIREDGYIVTNAHVIEGADKVVARLRDGTRLPLSLVAADEKTDIALLKAEAHGLPAITWGDSNSTRVGEIVCAIGAPYQLDFTLTTGVISAKGRSHLTETIYEDYLQTDAAISPGNSGGPLCDLEGNVIGVNTLISGLNHSIGFAIPSQIAKQVSDALMTTGRVVRPWLGIRIETLGDKSSLQQTIGFERGVLVRAIEPNTPAAQSDLRPADVIVEVDGAPVASARDVQQAILRKSIGQEVALKIWRRAPRGGVFLEIPMTTAELPETPLIANSQRTFSPMSEDASENSDASSAPLGLQFQSLSPEVAQQLNLTNSGVIITHVEPGSAADAAGIIRRDVITAMGQDDVRDAESFQMALDKLRSGEATTIQIEREGKKTYAILKR